MNLIVNIPKVYYDYCKAQEDPIEIQLAVKNGIPLDKMRTEIEQLPTTKCTETRRIYIDADDFKEDVLAIIDRYMSESEDTKD